MTDEQMKMIQRLRERTGYGKFKCKNLLELYNWDIEEASKPDLQARQELKEELKKAINCIVDVRKQLRLRTNTDHELSIIDEKYRELMDKHYWDKMIKK